MSAPSAFKVLDFLQRFDARRGYMPTVQEIAAYLGMSAGTVHARLLGLEAEGWITVSRGPVKRRQRAIRITVAGYKALTPAGRITRGRDAD